MCDVGATERWYSSTTAMPVGTPFETREAEALQRGMLGADLIQYKAYNPLFSLLLTKQDRRRLVPVREGNNRIHDALWFCGLAVVPLVFLFRDELLHGYVLGQADFLFDFLPWQPHRPAGWRIHNRLLGDISTLIYPFMHQAKTAVLSGRLPLWSSNAGAGLPLFAAFQTGVLSPFSWFDFLLPLPGSFALDVAVRLLVGGLGMYLFLRSLPVCREAALLGGIAFLLNPFSVVWLEHPPSAVVAWLPWLLLAVDESLRRAASRSIGVLALVTALMLLAGHPETAFEALLLAGAYACYRGFASRNIVKTLIICGTGVLLGALVSSVQLVPFLEYARDSRILAARSAAGHPWFTSPPAAFVTAFVPNFYGTPVQNRFVLDGTNYCEMQLYAGLSTWVFAAMAFAHRRLRGHALFFLVAGAVAVLIMYGTPVARWATVMVPPLRVAALSKFGLLAITGLGIGSAIGMDAMVKADKDSSVRLLIVGLATAAMIAGTVFIFLHARHDFLVSKSYWIRAVRSSVHSMEWLGAALVGLVVVARWKTPNAVAVPIGLLTVDLLAFANGFHAGIPPELSFPDIPELSILKADSGVFRVAGWVDTLLPNTALMYDLQDFRVYDGIGIRRYEELLDVGFRFTGNAHQLVNLSTPQLLDLLNIKYVLTPADIELPADRFQLLREGPTRVYVNQRVLPRAFLVDDLAVHTGDEARRVIRSGNIDLARTAIVSAALSSGLQPAKASTTVGTVSIRHYGDDFVSLATQADGRRLLVLSDVDYPGWTATIDGRTAPIHQTDYAFRGVSVPAGDHVVEFRYRPASVRYGAYASAAGIILLGWLWYRSRTSSPRGPERVAST